MLTKKESNTYVDQDYYNKQVETLYYIHLSTRIIDVEDITLGDDVINF